MPESLDVVSQVDLKPRSILGWRIQVRSAMFEKWLDQE